MSYESINRLLGRAMIDDNFAHKLLANPLQTALEGGIDLTSEEQAVLRNIKAGDIAELGQHLLEQLDDKQ